MPESLSSYPSTKIAIRHLKAGDVIAYPTEAVWGLGCDPFDQYAVEKILSLKSRPVEKGVILVAASAEQLGFLLEPLTEVQRQKMALSWPGPNTWIVPHSNLVPPWISGKHDGVAIRVSAHPLVKALCDGFGGPIVSTSANPAGLPPPVSRWQVLRYFKNNSELDFVTQGVVGPSKQPSCIRDLLSGEILRAGG